MRNCNEFSVIRYLVLGLVCVASSLSLQAQSSVPAKSADESALSAKAQASAGEDKIKQQITALHLREKDATVHELGYRWALIGSEYGNLGNVEQAEAAYNHALHLLAPEPAEAMLYADVLDQLGALYRIYGRMDDARRCYRAALTVRAPFGDPLIDARSRARLAELALLSRNYKEAYAETDQAYQSMVRMHDPDSGEVISALIVRAYAACGMHKYRKAQDDAAEALKRSLADFSETSMPVGASLVVLGSAQLKSGETPQAEESLHHAVDLFKAQLTGSDPRLTYAMTQYRESLLALHREQDAQRIHNELEVMALQPQPGCGSCTVSAFALRSPASPQQRSSGDRTMRATGGAVASMLGAPALQAP